MNERDRRLMQGPSIDWPFCPFCGRRATNRHHIVPRSRGGKDGPTVTVCGMGNASGCHGKLHAHRLHMDFHDGVWWWIETEPMKDERADMLEGWRPIVEGPDPTEWDGV